MSDIEDEIRRQLVAERAQPAPQATGPWPSPALPGAVPPLPSSPTLPSAPSLHSTGNRSAKRKGLAGALTAVGIALAKFWGVILVVLLKLKTLLFAFKLLTIGKVLIAGGSMMLSMFVYSAAFGWPMGVGFVLLLLIHESGHALAAKHLGRRIGLMVFVPFMGAFVTREATDTAAQSAFIGIMGPVAGTVGSAICVLPFYLTHKPFWLALAAIGFFLNLINLAPAPILDGGRIVAVFSPKLLLPGLALTFLIFWRNPMIWMFAFMSLPYLFSAWKTGSKNPYFQSTTQEKWTYGMAYLGLVFCLTLAYTLVKAHLIALRHVAM